MCSYFCLRAVSNISGSTRVPKKIPSHCPPALHTVYQRAREGRSLAPAPGKGIVIASLWVLCPCHSATGHQEAAAHLFQSVFSVDIVLLVIFFPLVLHVQIAYPLC